MHVALVTVGDELLAGETVNTNAAWLGRRLRERGADLERMTVVPDRVGDIAEVVNEYRARYDAVVVTGGLGPTHDDVTMEGVAAAFGTELTHSDEAEAWLAEEGGYTADDLADGTTHIPARAEFLRNPSGVAPGCIIGNVYVLAGMPDEMKAMFELVTGEFTGQQRYVEVVEAAEPESELLDRIGAVQEEFGVRVGSYPGEVVRLRLEGTDPETVDAAAAWLRERVEEPGG
jgi:molybdenum cofactor synthesis domain-containing protein